MRSFLFSFKRNCIFLIALIASCNVALASGSYSTGGGDMNQAYNSGKAAVYKKLLCSSCPFAGQEIDATKAKDIMLTLTEKPELSQNLSESELEGVVVYLKRRYKLD